MNQVTLIEKAKQAGKAINKSCNWTDEEVESTIKILQIVVPFLKEAGEKFALPKHNLALTLETFGRIQDYRKEEKKQEE